MQSQPRRFLKTPLATLACLLIGLSALGQVHKTVEARIVADLIDRLSQAKAQHAAEISLRPSGICGGVDKRSIYHHPLHEPSVSTIDYALGLPKLAEGERLFLAFSIGLSDGAKLTNREDGVAYSIRLNGESIFRQAHRKNEWAAHAIDISSYAGEPATLTLAVDSLKNSSYDWAMWGEPVILKFSPPGYPPRKKGPVSGVILAKRPAHETRTLMVNDQRHLVQPANDSDSAWFPVYFETGKLEASPVVAWPSGETIIAHFPHQLVIDQIACEQVIPIAGDFIPLAMKVRNAGRGHYTQQNTKFFIVTGTNPLPSKFVPHLAPGEEAILRWRWKSPTEPKTIEMYTPFPGGLATHKFKTYAGTPTRKPITLQNDRMRIDFIPGENGFEYARIHGRDGDDWFELGVWAPLAEVTDSTDTTTFSPRDIKFSENNNCQFATFIHDTDRWAASVEVILPKNGQPMRILHQFKAKVDGPLLRATGPSIHLGDGTFGAAKSWGLFPGLEFLSGPESSSNPRDLAPPNNHRITPHPHKVTAPFMAVTISPESKLPPTAPGFYYSPDSLYGRSPAGTVSRKRLPSEPLSLSLTWDPGQEWDGRLSLPTAHFASPNQPALANSHHLALSIPSIPKHAPEHPGDSFNPYPAEDGQSFSIHSELSVTKGSVLRAFGEWITHQGGLPEPNPPPRSFDDEMALCRIGFLETVRGDRPGTFRHCIDWASNPSAGFNLLLWLDGLITGNTNSLNTAVAATEPMRDDQLVSPSLTHILRWELPFHYGRLAKGIEALDRRIAELASSQHPDGGWRQPQLTGKHARLGQAGDAVSGTVARQTMDLLRHARITGSSASLKSGLKALGLLNSFALPRGSQMWECPMYQPDILAAAYAVAANHDAWRCTGEDRYLSEAIRWAETGVPFIYLWTLPARPMMLGATIPVFGSTFFSHSWLGVPVQWCGLVYSYHVWQLQETLTDRPHLAKRLAKRSDLGFTPADWRRIVRHITVSAMHQQFAEGDKIGSYPDSIVDFEKKMPAFINPEDIMANVLLLNAHNPDIKTVRLGQAEQTVTISSAAKIQTKMDNESLAIEFDYYPGQPVHFLVNGIQPKAVSVNGKPLPRVEYAPDRNAGWWQPENSDRVYITTPPQTAIGQLEISF